MKIKFNNIKLRIVFMVFIVFFIGCSQGNTNKDLNRNIPENVLREFLIVSLNPNESTIRSLIIDHKDAYVLWQGSYPKEMAKILENQYNEMEIKRINESNLEKPDQVLLQSSATPIPMKVVKINGDWKVDASPIIEFRLMTKNENEKK